MFRLPFTKKSGSGKFREAVAEAGLSLFVSLGVFTIIAAALEMAMPGWLTDHLPPQALLAALVVCGAAAALGERRPASRRGAALFGAVGVVTAAAAGWAAWSYFGESPDLRLALTAAAVLAVGAVFWVAFYPDLGQK